VKRINWYLPTRHRSYDRVPASVWIRALQLIPHLERRGIGSVVNEASDAAVCVLVRTQNAGALRLAREARARGSAVVFDLCVNYFDETGELPGGYGVTGRHVDDCRRMLEVADVVTAASAFIASRARAHHPRVVYLPDSVDREHFRFEKAYPEADGTRPTAPPSAIWCGNAAKAHELERFLPLLARREIPLTIVSDLKPRLSVPFTFVRWRHASAPADLLRGDVCIAPRQVDSPYNLGHSAFKVAVFLAQGVPALASPVPSYREVLIPERSGLLCDTLAEWATALDRVCAEPELLRRWSKEACAAVQPLLTEHVADRYAALFRELGA
jgi:glycosyltransferase involved in cell wall biosynthesis